MLACIHLPHCYDSLMQWPQKILIRYSSIAICCLATSSFTSAQNTSTPTKASQASPYPSDNSHPGPAWFINVAGPAGLRMENVNGGVDTKKYIIETTGSGVAIIDYDNDGWP